jgi:hypothetical protein
MSYRTFDDAVADREQIYAETPWIDHCDPDESEYFCNSYRSCYVIVDGHEYQMRELAMGRKNFASRIMFFDTDNKPVCGAKVENLYQRHPCFKRLFRRTAEAPRDILTLEHWRRGRPPNGFILVE